MELNKIYNKDCLEGMKSLKDNCIQLTIADIPYGEVTKNGEKRANYNGQLRSFNKGKADEITFNLNDFLKEIYRVTEGSMYIFCGIEQVSHIYSWFDNKKDVMKRQCAWVKSNPSPVNGQHMWLSTIENCVFIKKRKALFNEYCKKSTWEYPIEKGKIHPTQKSLKLISYLIKTSSKENDIVFDPCVGSGTTAVACLKTNRNFIGFELEEKYCNIALKRIAKFDKNYLDELPEEERPAQQQLF